MSMDIKERLAAKRGEDFTSGFVKALLVDLKLPSGIVCNESGLTGHLTRGWVSLGNSTQLYF